MGTSVAAAWAKAAKQLLECTTKEPGSAEAHALLQEAKGQVYKLQLASTPPKAAWKKLVQQHQVQSGDGARLQVAHFP